MNRRTLLKSGLLALGARRLIIPALAAAETTPPSWRHGFSHFGILKYDADFKNFDYVNTGAPKGGTARQIALGSFDNFNVAVADVKGTLAAGIDLIYDSLLVPSFDEVSSAYGLLAEAVSYPEDFSSIAFRLRPQAKWHDGASVSPDDVLFSFDTWKKYSPQSASNYRHVVKAERIADREIKFTFDGPGNRELPQIIGQMSILPKHWWQGTDKDGKPRNVGETTLEPPLGGGAYRIREFTAGRSIVYERVSDYWAGNLNVNVGRNNLAELRNEYFRDATVAIEALKAGDVDWRIENSAKNWAVAYDCPAVNEKRIILEEFPINNIGIMQAFAFNIRRDKFKDPRVRLAFNYAFNFEDINKQFFFGQYKRIASYFEGTELAATGLPTGKELEILKGMRDNVPSQVFTTPYSNPVSSDSDAVRANMRQARHLMEEAGYEVRNQQLVNKDTGKPFAVELLGNNALFERVFLFYKPSLERLGVTVTVRTVDEPQYENRLRDWDFDIITYAWAETLLPGNEQRGYWGSAAAGEAGSENVIGIKNSAVDAIIEKVIFAESREDLTAAVKALDRVLLWNHYVVPQWSYSKQRVARWDRFGHPDPLPKYGMSGFPSLWWWDAVRAAKVGNT